MRSTKLVKRQRQVHGYFATTAYVLATIHVGQGLSAYVQLQGEIVELAMIIHWVHILLAIAFLAFFTKVLIDGYRGVMRCRRGHILLVLNAVLIVLGYVIRNISFGEIIYPFL